MTNSNCKTGYGLLLAEKLHVAGADTDTGSGRSYVMCHNKPLTLSLLSMRAYCAVHIRLRSGICLWTNSLKMSSLYGIYEVTMIVSLNISSYACGCLPKEGFTFKFRTTLRSLVYAQNEAD